MATEQLVLNIPGWEPLALDPTPAMCEGKQAVVQCSWCGCVVIPPHPPELGALARCPACNRDAGWWRQVLPLAGVSQITSDTKD